MTRTIFLCGVLALFSLVCKTTPLTPEDTQQKTTTSPMFKSLKLQTTIGEGKDKQVELLFEGTKRKIQQITLRNNAVLAAHQAAEPITIQCVAGKGILYLGEQKESVELVPGALFTLEPNLVHAIDALPAVSVLVTRFTDK
ncbi:MAG: hypothetical protein JNJ50_20730 [Acidobacteria bacterium]|nr:hypothetical protein [Acidobacteriota bacterium]